MPRPVLVGACRTPFVPSGGAFARLTSRDLAVHAVRSLLNRHSLKPGDVDELILGQVLPMDSNPARLIALDAGLKPDAPAYTINQACVSSLQAIANAAEKIISGQADLVVACGTEVLSDVPILLSRKWRQGLFKLSRAKSVGKKLGAAAALFPWYPGIESPSLAEPSTKKPLGLIAEDMAAEMKISRAEQDDWALESHRRAAANASKLAPMIAPLEGAANDLGVRANTSKEALARLKPSFKDDGTVTAGNASPLTDGAAAVLIAREDFGLQPLMRLRSCAFTASAPADGALYGPVSAIPKALGRAGLTLDRMDRVEMHEAFAAQVLATSRKLGGIDLARANVWGGSISIGHPFGATGARLVMTLAAALQDSGGRLGLVASCALGGIGCGMVWERC